MDSDQDSHVVRYIFPGYLELLKTHFPLGEHWFGESIVGMFLDDPERLLALRVNRNMLQTPCKLPKLSANFDTKRAFIVWKEDLVDSDITEEVPDTVECDRKDVRIRTCFCEKNGQNHRFLISLEFDLDLLPPDFFAVHTS